jgi:hypothetical protein
MSAVWRDLSKRDQMVPGMYQPPTRMDEAAAQAGVRHRLRCNRSISGLLKPRMYSVAPINSNQKELKIKISKKMTTSVHDVR